MKRTLVAVIVLFAACGSSADSVITKPIPRIVSVGVLLRADKTLDGRELIVVDRLVVGGPAEQAGVKEHDAIWSIDGQDTVGLGLMEVVHRLRGPEGEPVVIGIGDAAGAARVVSVARADADPSRSECLEGDCAAGRGVRVDAFGDLYEGEFVAGKPHGQGKLTARSGRVYSGGFEDGAPHGSGILVTADGVTVSGVFAYGEIRGRGKVMLPDGDVYDGQLAGLAKQGEGTLTRAATGEVWTGRFDGDRFVEGTWTRRPGPDKRQCTRAMKDGQVAATGVIEYDPSDPARRVRFEGAFGDDCVANGRGVMTYSQGKRRVAGRFANDVPAR